jgi:hypothetical protein
MLPRARLLALSLGLCLGLPATAQGAQTARISARFDPERLGAATTVSLSFAIWSSDRAPAALTAVQLAYPPNLGFATSGLGVAACPAATLEEVGPLSCPPNSRMGGGDAQVEIPIGPEMVRENVSLQLFAGPSPDGYLHVLLYVNGLFPVSAQVVMSGVLLPGGLSIVIPPIPSLPAGPYVAVTRMRLTLGGNLTYYERVGTRLLAYHPAGVGLPRTCPRGGFSFAASFAFLDGSASRAHTAVPCPRRR